MSTTTLKGAKPLSEKNKEASLDQIFGNILKIPAEIKKELDAKNLEGRFIRYEEFVKLGGMHPRGWEPYKPDVSPKSYQLFGSNPDGFIRRKDLVLASRSKELCDLHRGKLKQDADRKMSSASQKAAAKGLKSMSSEVSVIEGYYED